MGDYYPYNTVTLLGQNGNRLKSLSQIKREGVSKVLLVFTNYPHQPPLTQGELEGVVGNLKFKI